MNNFSPLTMLFTITLPLVMTVFIAAWLHNKHFDALNARITDLGASLNRRIDSLEATIRDIQSTLRDIQSTLRDLDRRITRLEERFSPIART